MALKKMPQVNILKHLYCATLLQFDDATAREFWKRVPLKRSGQVLTEAQLFDTLWSDRSKYNAKYLLGVLACFEVFLKEKKLSIDDFQNRFFMGIYPGRYLEAGELLYKLNPHLSKFFSGEDLRSIWLETYPQLNIEIFRQSIHELIWQKKDGKKHESLLMFSIDNPYKILFNYEFWVLPWWNLAPLLFGEDEFQTVELLADSRDPKQVFKGQWKVEDSKIYLNKEHVGAEASFADFATKFDFAMKDFDLSDKQCWVFSKDILDENGTICLKANILYKADEHFIRLKYIESKASSTNPLQGLIESNLSDEEKVKPLLHDRHISFLQNLNKKVMCVYHRNGESISINGKHFVRNVPAKIFRKVMQLHFHEGRTEFENLEFKKDPEICLDVVNPNFEGRLNRLMAKLESEHPELLLIRHRRGGFKLVTNSQVYFRTV